MHSVNSSVIWQVERQIVITTGAGLITRIACAVAVGVRPRELPISWGTRTQGCTLKWHIAVSTISVSFVCQAVACQLDKTIWSFRSEVPLKLVAGKTLNG